MIFIDREEEMNRLDRLAASAEGGLAVVYGRRRIGKTRVLLEWSRRHGGLYTVADQSAPEIQRRYFAEAAAALLPGFADVDYPDWSRLLSRLVREAKQARWRGPVIFDELPYLVSGSPELPSVLQRWLDHEAAEARLIVALAGSSQRMMQGLVLSASAPLYGRAREILELRAIEPVHLREAFPGATEVEMVELFTAWGGVPRYWELAAELGGSIRSQIDRLVLDPLGPLHREPDHVLIEELPPALETRPILDAIASGAHRVSEIAGRIGRPATSMARPLGRLTEMGLVRREVPFGESEKKSRRSLYKIEDLFFRMWFRLVAPQRAVLAAADRGGRIALLKRCWGALISQAWEDLCRHRLPRLSQATPLGRQGPWGPGSRWWRGEQPEWDLVSASLDGERLLLGEARFHSRPMSRRGLERAVAELCRRQSPELPAKYGRLPVTHCLFVPVIGDEAAAGVRMDEVVVVTAAELLR